MYDLDLITIGNLNQAVPSSSTNNLLKPALINDDLWYPVPIQSAVDYYEQLDPLLPTQYELLLKQVMRLQSPPSTPSGLVANGAGQQQPLLATTEPLGWKQVWDCFYDLTEAKLNGELEMMNDDCVING
jgi:hypothetical protein